MQQNNNNVYYVYLHRRADDNEVFYVGKGKNKRAYRKEGRSQWWKSIANKHGFTVEIVEKCLEECSAFELEVELIKFYRDSGHTLCNICSCGQGASGAVRSEETRRRIGDANRGKTMSAESRKKMGDSKRGAMCSIETRERMSVSQRKRLRSTFNAARTPKRIVCSLGNKFLSAKEAVEWLHLRGSHATESYIHRCCKRLVKSAYGLIWRYPEDSDDMIAEML